MVGAGQLEAKRRRHHRERARAQTASDVGQQRRGGRGGVERVAGVVLRGVGQDHALRVAGRRRRIGGQEAQGGAAHGAARLVMVRGDDQGGVRRVRRARAQAHGVVARPGVEQDDRRRPGQLDRDVEVGGRRRRGEVPAGRVQRRRHRVEAARQRAAAVGAAEAAVALRHVGAVVGAQPQARARGQRLGQRDRPQHAAAGVGVRLGAPARGRDGATAASHFDRDPLERHRARIVAARVQPVEADLVERLAADAASRLG